MNKMQAAKVTNKLMKFTDDALFNKTILKSGLTVISEQVPGMQSFALGFAVNAGSRNDMTGYEGIAHFIEHIAFRRTRNHTGKRIAGEFETMGAYINAYTTKELTFFYVRALNVHLKKCLNLLSEVVFHPAFRDSDINMERDIILEEISSYEDDPEEIIFDIGEGAVFRNSPLEHPIAGLAESVGRTKSDNLISFHQKFYNPENIILSYSGMLPHDDIAGLADKLELTASGVRFENPVQPDSGQQERIVLDKQFQQSHVLYILKTEGFGSADRYPLGIINIILGDGLSSRLNQLLREKLGLVYTVYSTLSFLADTGSLGIYAAGDNKKINKIEEMIKREINKIISEGFSDREILKAKEQLKSSTIMALEGVSARMQSIARTELATGSYESLGDTVRFVDALTKSDIEQAIKKYLAPMNWSEVVFIGNK